MNTEQTKPLDQDIKLRERINIAMMVIQGLHGVADEDVRAELTKDLLMTIAHGERFAGMAKGIRTGHDFIGTVVSTFDDKLFAHKFAKDVLLVVQATLKVTSEASEESEVLVDRNLKETASRILAMVVKR